MIYWKSGVRQVLGTWRVFLSSSADLGGDLLILKKLFFYKALLTLEHMYDTISLNERSVNNKRRQVRDPTARVKTDNTIINMKGEIYANKRRGSI